MVEDLTDRARKVIGRADRIARARGAAVIDTHHLLLALIEPGSGIGADILSLMGIRPERVREIMERIDPPSPAVSPAGTSPRRRMLLTAQAEQALKLAGTAAEALGHEVIGTEHLLLGLLEQETGAAAAVLRAMGLTAAEVRGELLGRLIDGLTGRLTPRPPNDSP
jgi:ATP-dependent Clp protease ATP-binding subunit ClpC